MVSLCFTLFDTINMRFRAFQLSRFSVTRHVSRHTRSAFSTLFRGDAAGPAAPVHAASRSRPVIAAAEVSVTAAMDRRDDDSSSASLPPSFPLTAHGPRTGPCSFSLAILALATSARPPSRGPSTCVVPSVKTRQLIPRVRRAQGRRRRLAGRPLTTRRRAWRSTGKTRALC